MTAIQFVPGPNADASDARTRVRDLPHLSTERIEDSMRRCGGNLTATAARLNCARSSLYRRVNAEPSLLETRAEIVESFVDEAEAAIVSAVKRGDVNAATFVLRTQGSRRGWSTWSARHEGEQRPEPPRPRSIDMTAALRALSPDELMALERIVAKLESTAKAGAGLDAGDDEGSRRHRGSRREHLSAGRGEVAASDAVDEVEAVAASDEVEDLTAEADCLATEQSNPGDLSKPE
jgi:hypothetical protein